MIQLHTLGDAVIKVGDREVHPSSPMVFAALLYLCVERGHRVPRAALQELLFPESDERSGAHSVRQLLYKLRQLGVPLEADAVSVTLPAAAVSDWTQGNGNGTGRSENGQAAPLLPGYQPSISPAFERWLDEHRSSYVMRARSSALTELRKARDTGNHLRVEEIATGLLKLDPLNEEATFALAEALVLSGQKRDGVRLLNEYAAEVGETSPQLRILADSLRRRITQQSAIWIRQGGLFCGRQTELALLLSHFSRAANGASTVSILWGDPGIGKTRLVQEFGSHVSLRPGRIEMAQCQPHDRERPLGALIDLVPKLLQARGALGIAPESLCQLRRLTGDGNDSPALVENNAAFVAAQIREALKDLLACVADEAPLAITIEDAHWLDEASQHLLLTTVPSMRHRLHLIMTRRGAPHFVEGVHISEHVFVRKLEPLSAAASAQLLTHALGNDSNVDLSTRDQCIALGGGNPLFLSTIAEHLRQGGITPSLDLGIQDLIREKVRILEPISALLLRIIAGLSNYALPSRMSRCTGMDSGQQLLAIQDLADRGLIVAREGALRCTHDLVAEVALAEAPSAIKIAIYERVAAVLEEDGVDGKHANLLWICAESWRLADNPSRAAAALQKCARYALEIGQPRFAVEALGRAQDLAAGTELMVVLEESIRAADEAYDPDTVLLNVERYKALRRQRRLMPASNTMCDLAEINALRRKTISVWEHRHRLYNCVLDKKAAPIERLRAARVFIYVAEQQLDRSAATELLHLIEPDFAFSKEVAEWVHLRMVFNCAFGDMSAARRDAELFKDYSADASPSNSSIALGNVGMVLFRSGDTDAGLAALYASVAEEERLQLTSLLVNDYARITYLHVALGDRTSAQEWHHRTFEKLKELGRDHAPAYLANAIDFNLWDGDHVAARSNLTILLKEYAEAATPYNSRVALGYDLKIRILSGAIREGFDVSEALRLHERGRAFVDHDILAAGLAEVLDAIGEKSAAKQLLDDYFARWRRERCPFPDHLLPNMRRLGPLRRRSDALTSSSRLEKRD